MDGRGLTSSGRDGRWGIAAAAAANSRAYDGYGYGYYGGGPVYVAPAPGPYYYGGYGAHDSSTVPYVNPQSSW